MVYLINPKAPTAIQVVNATRKELAAFDYKYIVIGGESPLLADSFLFPDIKTVFVHDADSESLSDQEIETLNNKGIEYIDGEHNLQNMYHSFSSHYRTIFPSEVMASTISFLEKSIQKCIEIAVTAVDRKIIPAGSRVISIAGENEEPDTAIVIEPSYNTRIIDSRIIKVVCHLFHKDW